MRKRTLSFVLALCMIFLSIPLDGLTIMAKAETELAGQISDNAIDEQVEEIQEKEVTESLGNIPEEEATNEDSEEIAVAEEPAIEEPEEIAVEEILIELMEEEMKAADGDITEVDRHVNRYLADSYLNSPGWFNDEAQQYPEGFFGMGALDDQFWWKPMAGFWKKLEATTGSVELDNSKKALYQALVMDMMSSYVQLDKEMKADLDDNGVYNFQTEENKWNFAAAAAGSSEAAALLKETVALSGQVSEKGELLGKLAKNLHGADTADTRRIVEETFRDHLMDIYSVDSADIDVLKGIDIGLSYAQTLGDVVNKLDQLSEIVKANENMKYILMDMQDNLDLAFASSYTGTSIEKAYEKQIMNDALQEMIDILEANETEVFLKYAEETVTDFRETSAEVAYSFWCDALWKELAAENPEVAAIHYGMQGGVFCADLFFKTNNKVDSAAKYNVLCKMYRVVYGGMKKQRKNYSYNKTDANAQNYVNYMHMYVSMYGMMIDAISQWAEESEIYAKCYASECKRTYFGLLEELPTYETFKRSMKSRWTNLKASANGYVYARYADAMADYAEQMNRKRLSTQQALQDAQTASEDATYVSNLSAILGEVQTYSAAPAIAVPSEAETEQLNKESQLGQFELQSQTISSSLTLQEDRTTYGDMTFSDGILDLNGHTLTVYGDFYHKDGQIRFNNGTLLILGNYWCRQISGTDANGNPTYTSSSGTLRMVDESDLMEVAGDFYWNSIKSWTDSITDESTGRTMLRAGTIQIGGNFEAYGWDPSRLEGCTHKEEFVNPNGTKIHFGSDSYGFNQVEFPEKAEGKDYYPITWTGGMRGFSLEQDMYLILPEVKYPEGYHKLNISGALDLNGHTLTLEGDVLHTGGQIRFDGGKLKIKGNYHVRQFDKLDVNGNPTYTYANGTLRMVDESDLMEVAGDFYWNSSKSWTDSITDESTDRTMLRAGTIQIGGNFEAYGWYPSRLKGDNKNAVYLKGNKCKKITLPSGSKFNVLKLDREPDDYTISPENCWEILYVAGKYYVEPEKNVFIGKNNICYNNDGTVSITKEGDETVNILITFPQAQENIVVNDAGEVTLPSGAVVTSNVNDKPVTVQSQATVSMNGVIAGQSVQIGDITVTAQEDTNVVVDESGNVTIPEGGTVTTQEDVTIALPQGGTMNNEEMITGTEMIVAGITITAPAEEELAVSTTGTVTAPSGSIVTKEDGTQSQMPQGGTITAKGEIEGEQVPVVDGEEGEQPSDPGTEQPSDPGTEQPSNPGTEQPNDPGTEQPSDPGTEQPSDPGTEQPSDPGQGGQPAIPSTKPDQGEQPTIPSTQPSQGVQPTVPSTQPSQGNGTITPSGKQDVASIKVGKVKSFKAKKKGSSGNLKLSWKKVSGVSGYEISYSLNKKFKKAKKITVSSKKNSIVIKKLKKNKKYYMRIRAYKLYKNKNGKTKKKYGKYTTIKIKIK